MFGLRIIFFIVFTLSSSLGIRLREEQSWSMWFGRNKKRENELSQQLRHYKRMIEKQEGIYKMLALSIDEKDIELKKGKSVLGGGSEGTVYHGMFYMFLYLYFRQICSSIRELVPHTHLFKKLQKVLYSVTSKWL